MKIKEALNFINATMTVRAKVDDDIMYVYEKSVGDDDWFMRISLYQVGWSAISADFETCLDDDASVMDLARVMDVVQRLICTPVKERFPEKKYLLVAKRKPDRPGLPKYVKAMATGFNEFNFYLTNDKSEAQIYQESVLEGIKEREPSLAPAIDVMKEEVKEYDRS